MNTPKRTAPPYLLSPPLTLTLKISPALAFGRLQFGSPSPKPSVVQSWTIGTLVGWRSPNCLEIYWFCRLMDLVRGRRILGVRGMERRRPRLLSIVSIRVGGRVSGVLECAFDRRYFCGVKGLSQSPTSGFLPKCMQGLIWDTCGGDFNRLAVQLHLPLRVSQSAVCPLQLLPTM